MKFVKGVTIFLVLCLAAYGAFTLLKRSPKIDLNEADIAALKELDISVSNGQAEESGLSPIFSVDGAPPIGNSPGTPSFGTGSSVPPSFLGGQSVPAPAFVEAAPRFAATGDAMQSEFLVPAIDVLPPPNFAEPAGSSSQAPFFDAPAFDAPPFEASPIPATESPPLAEGGLDGIISNTTFPPASTEFLTPPNPAYTTAPVHIPPPVTHTYPPINDISAPTPVREGVRRIRPESENQDIILTSIENSSVDFSSGYSVPVDSNSVRYTLTAARSLAFEPVRRENTPNAPVVAFIPPKQEDLPQPSEQIPPPVIATSAAVRQIGTPRLIENSAEQRISAPPVIPPEPPAVSETLERFVQTQRQRAESGDPERLRLAFVQLSQLYEQKQLNDAERMMMQPILDSLALKVIYARDTHILEPSYQVKPGETVESIAKDFNVPAALLRKINGLAVNQEVAAGTTLKVVVGQFDARISIQRKELILLLGGLYAGQFPFTLPHSDIPARSGEFFVKHKTDRKATLNNGWILATADVGNATFVFADQDAREIFDILSEMSVIVLE